MHNNNFDEFDEQIQKKKKQTLNIQLNSKPVKNSNQLIELTKKKLIFHLVRQVFDLVEYEKSKCKII